ncbi:MlaA family lipoprotein [Vibrio sp.]|uniref:VacJ family lipoprotein n=1 Tax=Vibrio viridaestus TaxID=2487322 RepID=A0A3N9TJL3_9VIBR|nr:MlaA family lipoprotein [Vibrio viridaestus]MDC0611693.1 MlaA family lipoprotein [Vibrio sp.]RQW64447.1 VacJ family lipoprotein [Vibrio viridaestus]
MSKQVKTIFVGVIFLLMLGCSSTNDTEDKEIKSTANIQSMPADESEIKHSSEVYDPIEGLNRKTWSLNYDVLDPYIFRPVSLAYVDYVPHPVRLAISNVFSNLDEPASMINNLLMGNGREALNHFNRFWINSTFGLFGLIDIASAAGIKKEEQKGFGDALGHYGVGNGPYLMVPAVGSYSPREATDLVDTTYLPLSYLNIWASIGKFVFEGMETRAALVNQEAMLKNSPDPYSLVRDVYYQRQDYKAEIDTDDYDPEQEELINSYLDQLDE